MRVWAWRVSPSPFSRSPARPLDSARAEARRDAIHPPSAVRRFCNSRSTSNLMRPPSRALQFPFPLPPPPVGKVRPRRRKVPFWPHRQRRPTSPKRAVTLPKFRRHPPRRNLARSRCRPPRNSASPIPRRSRLPSIGTRRTPASINSAHSVSTSTICPTAPRASRFSCPPDSRADRNRSNASPTPTPPPSPRPLNARNRSPVRVDAIPIETTGRPSWLRLRLLLSHRGNARR